jgi:protein-S-isoprenylcysteine O-methyltransferase Ste14
MLHLIASIGALAGASLIVLLAISWLRGKPGLWPPAPAGSWQSMVFWSLFRTLNVAALATAALDWKPMTEGDAARGVLALAALAGGLIYVSACLHLGRDNLYGGKSGLVTSGIYGWSRNPQYALAMPTYIALALAALSLPTAILAAMLVAVFVLMALTEEPWLEAAYGKAYAAYAAEVPRFYNVRRLIALLFFEVRRPPTAR